MSVSTASGQVATELFIGGEPRKIDERLEIYDPANPSALVGTAAAGGKEDALAAVAAAKAAFPAWSALSAAERAARIGASIEGLEATRDDDARILTLENGKPFQESWIDMMVLSVRTGLALELADQVEAVEQLPGPGTPEGTSVLLADPLNQLRLDPSEQPGVDLSGDPLLHRLDRVQPLALHLLWNGIFQVAIRIGAGAG